ncbi:MAG: lectin like domain-containing protein, partial [Armatimonadota bacterium]
ERYLRELAPDGFRAQSEPAPASGLIPPPLDLSHNRGKRISMQTWTSGSLPAFYDLRAQVPARLSPVKSQGACGSCWAFASYGSLESCLLPEQPFDFSENHLKNTHGFDLTCCEGGNHWISAAYLARWSGPALESDDPYNPSSCVSPTDVPVRKHVQRVDFIPDRAGPLDNDNIKQAVMDYGAVYTTYYHSSSYYNAGTYSYYYNGSQPGNHAVCVVGWDDNYDKSKFLNTPPGNGAFIVRNSWGSGWGQGGYFYVSYYDTLFGLENAVFHNAEPTNNYNQIYQYDPYGWVGSVGYGTNTAWFANVFSAASETQIEATAFYVASPQSAYELRVYVDPDLGPIHSGGPAAVAMGTIANAGYQTVTLGSPVFVESGQRFSVVVKLTTPGYTYPIPIEQRLSGYS